MAHDFFAVLRMRSMSPSGPSFSLSGESSSFDCAFFTYSFSLVSGDDQFDIGVNQTNGREKRAVYVPTRPRVLLPPCVRRRCRATVSHLWRRLCCVDDCLCGVGPFGAGSGVLSGAAGPALAGSAADPEAAR